MHLNLNLNQTKNESFEVFAAMNPFEAIKTDKKRFCQYVRKNICETLTDSEIEKFINKDLDK
jgi:hypothetical protein